MKAPTEAIAPIRQALIGTIRTMLPGTRAEAFRPAGSSGGENAKPLGPYFKHRFWEDGRNISKRVPAHETAQLREDIDNAQRFHQLTTQLARLNIAHTLTHRAAQTSPGATDAKQTPASSRLR